MLIMMLCLREDWIYLTKLKIKVTMYMGRMPFLKANYY